MPTIRDVARAANVSVGTVSNVLNGNASVREETRQRVLTAIKALNYHPSAAARSLTTQRSGMVGLIRTELRPASSGNERDPFVSDLIDGISNAASHTETGLVFWTVPVGPAELALYERIVYGKQVDGLILFALRKDDPRVAFLKETAFPFVMFGRMPDTDPNCCWVDVDGAAGIEAAVDHLASLGHRRIGYIAPPAEQYLATQRWEGFERGMARHQLTIDPDLVYEGDFTEQSGQLGTHFLLDHSQPPTAIICNNDRMAFGAMRAIQSRGLEVGRDVSVIGFDDIPLARYWPVPLTTISQPTIEIGVRLFELLQAVIAGKSPGRQAGQLIRPVLQVRQSTGRPR
ncbi:MAG: LacI family DNA-binding transcriptional regulator [Anaerolineae bacterium]